MKVVLEKAALQELYAASNYFADQSLLTAEKFISDFEHCIQLITEHPFAWPEKHKGFRKCLFKKFRYGLIYKIEEQQIVVVAVMSDYRKPDYWLERIT